MMRDYARPRYTKPKESYKAYACPKQTPGWLWLLTGLVLGSLMVGFYWFIESKNRDAFVVLKKEPLAPPSENPPEHPPIEKPRFDFYTLLPNMETAVPVSALPDDAPPPPAPTSALPLFVQAGLFEHYGAADTLKAQLVLMGFDTPKIETVEIKPGEKRFKVLLGPFQEEKEAQQLVQRLKSQGISEPTLLKQ